MDFDQIYQDYFQDVFYFLRSLSRNASKAEELTQETFTKALQHIGQYDGRKDIKAWLLTIAKHTYIDDYRREKHCAASDIVEGLPDSEPQIIEKLMDQETAFQIHSFLHQMPEPYKEVFSLRVFGELSFEQIGKLFGKSASWARVTYYRAKQKILQYWEGVEHE